ncbi:MAG: cynR 5 [Sporomusa sp.]|jgi:DNA-binding transcriptional LysR family regulator|nr:cynR 5 [Sporomusa sp.]
MELRQLEYFQMVCRLNSISKAAEHLHIAQPSVSIAIQKLEEELGIQLFHRTHRQITPTSEGLIFLQRVNKILTQVGDSINEMNDLKSFPKGSIKIGIPPMIGIFLFPQIFAQFRKQYPHIELTAVEGGSLTIQNLVEQGRIDIGIITQSNSSSALEILPITTGQIHVCLPPHHPLSSLASIPFNKLRDQPFILLKEDTYNRQVVIEECKKYHFTPNIVFSSSQVETIISLIELEIGISFLFDAIAKNYSKIYSCPLSEPINFQIVLAWNKNRYLTSTSKAFIDFMTGTHLLS